MIKVTKEKFDEIKQKNVFHPIKIGNELPISENKIEFFAKEVGQNDILLLTIANDEIPISIEKVHGNIIECDGAFTIQYDIPEELKVEKEEVISPVMENETVNNSPELEPDPEPLLDYVFKDELVLDEEEQPINDDKSSEEYSDSPEPLTQPMFNADMLSLLKNETVNEEVNEIVDESNHQSNDELEELKKEIISESMVTESRETKGKLETHKNNNKPTKSRLFQEQKEKPKNNKFRKPDKVQNQGRGHDNNIRNNNNSKPNTDIGFYRY